MNDSPTEQLLTSFLDSVETLLNRYTSLKSRVQSLKQKIESLEDRNRKLQQQNDELKENMDQQRLEFSELAGELEVKFDQIKEEAGSLLSESQE